MSSSEAVCIGDTICLFSEETEGFVFGLQSCDVFSEVAVGSREQKVKPLVPDPQVVSFRVCVANRYKQNKKLRKLESEKVQNAADSYSLNSSISHAKIAARAESEDNDIEQQRQASKKLLYGQTIQLRHEFTQKYIHASTTLTSRSEPNNMLVELVSHDLKSAQFRVMPRYKVKAEGDVVFIDDQVVFESIKSPGQYLYVSRGHFPSMYVYSEHHELSLSVRQSGFSIIRQRKPEAGDLTKLRAGVPIRLFHKEIEAYLVAEGLFGDEVTEDVHFRLRPVSQTNPKSLSPSSSAITYWQFEFEDRSLEGDIIQWEQQLRIRHMITRKYLKIEKDGVIKLCDTNQDPLTVFRLHSVIREMDEIEFETYCRIEHVVTGKWLSASSEPYKSKVEEAQNSKGNSMASLKWTTAQFVKVKTDVEMKYDDAFTVQHVYPDLVENFNFMAGCVPFIAKLISDRAAGKTLTAKPTQYICSALDQMGRFMIVQGEPDKRRQKLLRNFRLVELLVKLLQIPLRGSSDESHLQKIFVRAYTVIYRYLEGNSRKNELYIAKHINFFQTQFGYVGEIGKKSALMVMELIKDNRKIVDRITTEHIDEFVNLLAQRRDYQYLDLLNVLCVCDGVALPSNQEYITRVWLMGDKKNVVYNTDLGQNPKIGKETDVVYVSTNSCRTWTPLHEFVLKVPEYVVDSENLDRTDKQAYEKYMFLTHQLDLFGKLCYGRNKFAIDVITKELGYLTWEEAYLCLSNKKLPDELRAKYCDLIIGLFVDIDENVSVLDRIKLTFVYDEVNDNADDQFDNEKLTNRSKITTAIFPELRDYISRFLDDNKDMTASLVGHNLLVEQVLRLVHYLVKYGYYGNTEDIKHLLGPFMQLLDGRNDKPYPKSKDHADSRGYNAVLEEYQNHGRFQVSVETKSVVDAKHQAMEVLDLFFNFRFNTRLEQFVHIFRKTHTQANHIGQTKPDLLPLLYTNFKMETEHGASRAANRRLDDIFDKSNYFKDGYDLVAILMDLSEYKYDKMLTKSMALLNRYYSAATSLFQRAVQAQVIMTPGSVQVYSGVLELLPQLQRLTKSKLSNETGTQLASILERLTEYCHLENELGEPHPMNQRILYNFNILTDIFEILDKEYDPKLAEQYVGMKKSLQRSFDLLKAMAKGNDIIQMRLFDRLSFLLEVKGAEPEMAGCVAEIFTGNKHTCMKILAHQIERIMQLTAEHRVNSPQFLDLLNAVVKVEEVNLPLKRNQGYVMKYFMQHRSEVAGSVGFKQAERVQLLKSNSNIKELRYLLSMVDLLATCAEGENRFIESICQTIFSLPELLEIVTDDKLPNSVKKPFLRFMLWVYMNTAGGIIESGAGDLPHDPIMWNLIEMLTTDIQKISAFVQVHPDETKQFLKAPPSLYDLLIRRFGDTVPTHSSTGVSSTIAEKMAAAARAAKAKEEAAKREDDGDASPITVSEAPVIVVGPSSEADMNHMHATLHYYMEAVMPSLQVFFRSYYAKDEENFPEEVQKVNNLGNALLSLAERLVPCISDDLQLNMLTKCVSSILSSSTLPGKALDEFDQKYSRTGVAKVVSDSRRLYQEEYKTEEQLNEQLNVFAENYALCYGGTNDIRTQIGFDSSEEYVDFEGNEELPLGREFQDHLRVFIDSHRGYLQAAKLIDQLSISSKYNLANESARIEQEQLDIKCLQLLRGFIHNEIIKLPNSDDNPKLKRRQMAQIQLVQNELETHQAILKTLPHLSKNSDRLIKEILAFMAALLYGGNEMVQQSLIEYFHGTREEQFFFAIKNRIDLSTMAMKEQRSLNAQYMAKVDEAIELMKAMRKARNNGDKNTMATLKQSVFGSRAGSKMGSRMAGSSARLVQGLGATPRGKPNSKKKTGSYMTLVGSNVSLKHHPETNPTDVKHKSSKVAPVENGVVVEVKAEKKDELDREEIAEIEAMAAEEMDMEYKDEGYIELVLKVLGLMCDGQNSALQNYLRHQPDNIKSFNLVGETGRFLQLLYSNINPNTISLVIQLFSTLLEFCSGNPPNQNVVFDSKVIDYINYILRNKQYKVCEREEVLELLSVIQQLLKAMVEVNRGGKDNKEVMTTLDLDSVHEIIMLYYKELRNPELDVDRRERITPIAFGFYHLIRRYEDIDEGFDSKALRLRAERLETADLIGSAWKFYEQASMSVELLKGDELQKVYFHVRDKSVLREEIKELFKYEVDRSSPTNKLREFLLWSRDIMEDIKHQRKMLSSPILKFFVKGWPFFNVVILLLSLLIAILVLYSWIDPARTEASWQPGDHLWIFGGNSNETFTAPRPAYRSQLPSFPNPVTVGINAIPIERFFLYVFGGFHMFVSLCILISFGLSNNLKLPTIKGIKRSCRSTFQSITNDDDDSDDEDVFESSLQVNVLSFKSFYFVTFFVLSVVGFFYEHFYAFHLLHITQNNQLLRRVILAVTKNGKSLLWVFILAFIIFYIYSIIAFGFFRDLHNVDNGTHCENLYECFINIIHKGMILSTLEVFYEEDISSKSYGWHLVKILFDLTFFIVWTTIGLNIIFGIIVDTFSELRDSKWQIDNDMRTTCFICSRESYDFEHQAGGFERHVKMEHNQWAYLFFFIHLSNTSPNDYSDLELFVHRNLQKDNIGFFPLNRALRLEDEEDEKDKKLDLLLNQVTYIMEKIKEQEASKIKEIEEKKQQEWVKKNTSK